MRQMVLFRSGDASQLGTLLEGNFEFRRFVFRQVELDYVDT